MTIKISFLLGVLFFLQHGIPANAQVQGLENIRKKSNSGLFGPRTDYLIDPSPFRAEVYFDSDNNHLVLENGLIRKRWLLKPNACSVGFDNLMTGEAMLRAVRPEATLQIDGDQVEVGGLQGQKNHAFLSPKWFDSLTPIPGAAELFSVQVGHPKERIKWKRRRHAAPNTAWPPTGVHLQLNFRVLSKSETLDAFISVHYEMYDGLPALSKWLTVHNHGTKSFTVEKFRAEELAMVEQENWVEIREPVRYPVPDDIHVETDFAFGGFNHQNANRHTVHWKPDPTYSTQVNYLKKTPCLLHVEPTYGPEQDVEPGQSFETFHVFELVFDRANRERRGLALRKMYRKVAPWVTENPITHHLLNSNPEQVKTAIDQAAEVGFEAVILSFGSGFNMENDSPEYLQKWKEVADYAESKGIEIGAYSLFSSRSVGGGNDVKSPKGEKPTFGRAPAATSEWGRAYFRKLGDFFAKTGFDQFENDGPYPGDVDVTPRPPFQKGEKDSRWAQWKIVSGLFKTLRETGVYINQPDYYFLVGGNKTGMGYREVNWSLPREQQVIHTRQNIYDGTWKKTPSMGWMHVPLAEYHGGGPAATIEPLHQHLDHYERMLRSNLGMGVQAHYRGPRLFDTAETKSRVKSVVEWFKKYRDILESDIVHGRRADGQDIDWILHANPALKNKGMLCIYNPLDKKVKRTIRVNLYYTGTKGKAILSKEGGDEKIISVANNGEIELEVTVPAGSMTWYLVR